MGLPSAGSYPMPAAALPRSRAARRIDPERAALLVHTMQNHFVGMFSAVFSPVVELVDDIVALRELAGTLGIPGRLLGRTGRTTTGAARARRRTVGIGYRGRSGPAAIIEPLAPRAGEHLLARVRPNASLRSHLGRLLRSPARDQLIVCRLHAHRGVLLTAADALMNDIQPFVVADAVADLSAERHSLALGWAADSGVVCATDRPLRDLVPHREPKNA
ncbi:isochorismatase family protein [Streptomyces sp. NBC_00887]|uniref:isochorismatase family protein n=1 Tax=Streptomyces sp. NBC_00887 TaxID=2975859 RepID=UPI003869171C|nr:isochorismatase family protein [Streptomyces sp. NBC_00887]WSY35826.1 isochorismatase family protein [Streptomyces sp. NBC_00887]